MSDLAATLEALEREHLRDMVRADPVQLGRLLHADFVEHGQSGRVWQRTEILARLSQAPATADGSVRELDRYEMIESAATHALTRWRASTRNAQGGMEAASWRSSWWVLADGRWQLRFHTGTRIADLLLALDEQVLCADAAGVTTLHRCRTDDFETALALRIRAVKPSLEQLGRFDPQRARERLAASWQPARTWKLMRNGAWVGFFTVTAHAGGWKLDHLYIDPTQQSSGLGSAVMQKLCALADALELPMQLTALRDSPANRFYARFGFEVVAESEWDIERARACTPRT
jgi:hypothetical protein